MTDSRRLRTMDTVSSCCFFLTTWLFVLRVKEPVCLESSVSDVISGVTATLAVRAVTIDR
jgi:hypothetical protein